MAYSDQNGRSRLQSQRGLSDGRRSSRSRNTYSTPSRNNGYQLRNHNIKFNGRGGGLRGRFNDIDFRKVLLLIAAILLLVIVFLGVSSCVRGCMGANKKDEAPVNEQDARVSVSVPAALTSEFTTALDQGEKLKWIAENADLYTDQTLLELALAEPGAIEMVAAYPTVEEKTASPYTGEVNRGEVPELYCWDIRWGMVDYDGAPLALTGSGPVAFAMAYMGLTGNNDVSPGDMAALATESGYSGGDGHTSGDFFATQADSLGLTIQYYEPSEDNLITILDSDVLVIARVRAGSVTDEAHWLLITDLNGDGSIDVLDPTCSSVSSHPWDAATIAGDCDAMYALAAPSSE